MANRIEGRVGPVVLMGDFNAQPGDEELEPLGRLTEAWSVGGDGSPGLTIPACPVREPGERVDTIFVNGGCVVLHVWVLQDDVTRMASDHYPVVAELTLKA